MKNETPYYEDVNYKFKAISLLHMLGYNSDVPAKDVGAELLYAIGNILEGCRVEDLDLRALDKRQLVAEMNYA